jgi:DMSO/TMAO reductase YedYZ heme-binding membrane subunit
MDMTFTCNVVRHICRSLNAVIYALTCVSLETTQDEFRAENGRAVHVRVRIALFAQLLATSDAVHWLRVYQMSTDRCAHGGRIVVSTRQTLYCASIGARVFGSVTPINRSTPKWLI